MHGDPQAQGCGKEGRKWVQTIFHVPLEIPPEITSDIVLVDVPLPKLEGSRLLNHVISREKNRESLQQSLTEDIRDQFLKAGGLLQVSRLCKLSVRHFPVNRC